MRHRILRDQFWPHHSVVIGKDFDFSSPDHEVAQHRLIKENQIFYLFTCMSCDHFQTSENCEHADVSKNIILKSQGVLTVNLRKTYCSVLKMQPSS